MPTSPKINIVIATRLKSALQLVADARETTVSELTRDLRCGENSDVETLRSSHARCSRRRNRKKSNQMRQRIHNHRRWNKMAKHQLKLYPLCKLCLDKNLLVAARVADHIEPHKGNQNKFWFGKLQSLCFECHNLTKRQVESHGFFDEIGEDGFPVDLNHPFNTPSDQGCRGLKRGGGPCRQDSTTTADQPGGLRELTREKDQGNQK
jgi:hypothetical protein